MSSEQQSCLRFSVEESIWFQKGQEVSELISIALDPDIQIYEQDQYVSIRGALLLTGEYQVNAEAGAEAEEEEYHPQARIVQEVEEREDGVCALHHRFPVDITIPKNRIQSLDDIYVAIESFDYSVPTRGCLQLDAELSISGIYGHQQSSPAWDEEQEEVYEVEPNRDHEEAYASQNAQNQEDSYEQDAEEEEVEDEEVEEQEQEEEVFEYEPMYRSANTDNEYEEDTYQYYTEEDEEEEILNQHEIDGNMQYNYNDDGEYAPFEVEARKPPATEEEAPYNPADFIYQDKAEDAYAPLHTLHTSKNDQTEEETSNVVSFLDKRKGQQAVAEAQQHEPANTSDEPRDENDLSLTKIFADDGEEDFTKLKICIVQQGESMDHIAERYDVSIQQLIRVNRLSTDDHINEGQLLYIPVKASSKS
ncbi:stage VI sporulation protein D [Sutcliffiella horikoshii]|uniref:stage VI sporulation protein D n=1 Tax=Sutcliffiella horikoshii TaxID=79883 RepID=UPI001EEDF43F|nr:stage VI sporulation protein D [Sutcliffiella horikoshii]MCG1022167.1 stage VI sporulation protein D [Sutcliffiella horikoshii]